MIPRDAVPAHLANKSEPDPLPPHLQPRTRKTLAEQSETFFAIAVVVSLLAHAALAYCYYDRPLGRIDPSLLSQQEDTFYVQRRQDEDVILEEESGATSAADAERTEHKLPDVSDLSLALLADDHQKDETPTEPLDAKIREMPEERPDELAGGSASLSHKPVQLPDSVTRSLTAKLNVEVKFNPGSGNGDGTGSGTGTGSGIGPGHGAGVAADILAASGLTRGGNLAPPALTPPKFQEKRSDVDDKREQDIDLATPEIDYAGLAFEGATDIDIPEHLDADFEYHVTRYIPPQENRRGWFSRGNSPDDDRPYFRVDIVPKKSLRRLHTMPKDLVILIDTSGSVPQTWVDQIIRGVRDGLASLNKGDRFNIVFFNQNAVFFDPNQIVEFNDETYRAAQQFLTDRKSKGYTDVNQALSRLLTRDLSVERVYNLLLISDGRPTKGVMDTRDLINLITRDNDLVASIYCVGVTGRQNRELLEFLAYRNKGYCVFVRDEFSVAQETRDLLSRLRFPIMKDVRHSVMAVDPEDVFPADLPNLHQGEKFVIFGRYDRARPFTMRLVGHNGRRLLDLTFTKDLSTAQMGDESMAYDWAFWKLHHLYSEMIRRGDTDEIRKQIDYLAKKYKLKTY